MTGHHCCYTICYQILKWNATDIIIGDNVREIIIVHSGQKSLSRVVTLLNHFLFVCHYLPQLSLIRSSYLALVLDRAAYKMNFILQLQMN